MAEPSGESVQALARILQANDGDKPSPFWESRAQRLLNHRDAVLDALGLEQIGWFYRDSTEPYLLWSSNMVKAPDWGTVLGSTPAYRLRAFSDGSGVEQ